MLIQNVVIHSILWTINATKQPPARLKQRAIVIKQDEDDVSEKKTEQKLRTVKFIQAERQNNFTQDCQW